MSFLKRKNKNEDKEPVSKIEVDKDELDKKSSGKKKSKKLFSNKKKERVELSKDANHPSSRVQYSKLGGFKRNRPTASEKQRLALQEKIPVKDVWNGCFVDDYGDLYPAFSIGTKNISMLSAHDLFQFITQLKLAFISINVESYQMIVVPMPFDLDIWLRENNRIKLQVQEKDLEIINLPYLEGESDSEHYDRVKKLKDFNDWRNEFLKEQEFYVTSKLKSGQITTKRSFLIVELKNRQNMAEILEQARTIENKFASTGINVKMLNEADARSLLYVMLNPLSPEMVEVPRLSKAPHLPASKLKADAVLEEEFKMDGRINDYTQLDKDKAAALVKERESQRIGFDGKTQLGREIIYPDAEKLNAPTDEEIKESAKVVVEDTRDTDMFRDMLKKKREDERNKMESEVRVERKLDKIDKNKDVSDRDIEAETSTLKVQQKSLTIKHQEALDDFDYGKATAIKKELSSIDEQLLKLNNTIGDDK